MSNKLEFRQPTEFEVELFEHLLQEPFPGREELRSMTRNVFVRNIDRNGSLEISSKDPGLAPVVKRVPVEAEVKDEDGVVIHILLHVLNGRPVELEIFKEDGTAVKHMPSPALFQLVILPPVPRMHY